MDCESPEDVKDTPSAAGNLPTEAQPYLGEQPALCLLAGADISNGATIDAVDLKIVGNDRPSWKESKRAAACTTTSNPPAVVAAPKKPVVAALEEQKSESTAPKITADTAEQSPGNITAGDIDSGGTEVPEQCPRSHSGSGQHGGGQCQTFSWEMSTCRDCTPFRETTSRCNSHLWGG